MDDSGGKQDSNANTGQNEASTPKNSVKPKRRSLVERELETSLTARVTSAVSAGDIRGNTSRYGRTRRLKTDTEFCDSDKTITAMFKSPKNEKSPLKSPAYKMHASNTLTKKDSPKTPVTEATTSNIEDQIENIITKNISLSRFGTEQTEEKSPAKKFSKVYIRKDLIQSKDKEETASIMKNMFSPTKSPYKPSTNTHLSNILERSSEKYNLNQSPKQNGYIDTSSVVKTLDFDGGKKKKPDEVTVRKTVSKSELFEREAKCEYQVGDLAWSRVGTYPFWPCIITRDPFSGFFVKKKLFGRVERDVLHVTFFGDNGRRGWIVDNMLRRFHGLEEFQATRDGFTSQSKKKDPRYYAAFFVSDKKQQSWNISVQEAESLMREPKRLRIDALNDLLSNTRVMKTTPKRQKSEKIVRTDSDVSLSESLYDTLFSEDDCKGDELDKTKNKRKKSLDVSEVVTACLDNMAAKTGISKIQKQSHMDRWLQKAKSKTPEKVQTKDAKVQTSKSLKEAKGQNNGKKSKKTPSKDQIQFILKNNSRGNENDTLGLLRITTAFQLNDHDYTKLDTENANPGNNQNTQADNFIITNGIVADDSCGIGIISKVETLSDSSLSKEKPTETFDVENNMSVVLEELIVTETDEGTRATDESGQKGFVTEVSEPKPDLEEQGSGKKQTEMDLEGQQDNSIKDQGKNDVDKPKSAKHNSPKDLLNANGSQTLHITMPSNNESTQNSESPSYIVTRRSKRLSLNPNIRSSKTKAEGANLIEDIVNGDISQEHKKHIEDSKSTKSLEKSVNKNKNVSKSCEIPSENVIQHKKGDQTENNLPKYEFKIVKEVNIKITRANSNAITTSVLEGVSAKGSQLENNLTSDVPETLNKSEVKNDHVTTATEVAVTNDVAKILEDFSEVDEDSQSGELLRKLPKSDFSEVDEGSLLGKLDEKLLNPVSENEHIETKNPKEQINGDSNQRKIGHTEAKTDDVTKEDFYKRNEKNTSKVNGDIDHAKKSTEILEDNAKSDVAEISESALPYGDLETETKFRNTTKNKKDGVVYDVRKEPQLSEEISGVEELLIAQLLENESKQADEISLSQNKPQIEKENLTADAVNMSVDEKIGGHKLCTEALKPVTPYVQKQSESIEVNPMEEISIVNKISKSDETVQDSLVNEEDSSEPESPDYEDISLDNEVSHLKIETEPASSEQKNNDIIMAVNSKIEVDSIPKLPRTKSYNYKDELITLRDFDVKITRMPMEPFQKNLKEFTGKIMASAVVGDNNKKNTAKITIPEDKKTITQKVTVAVVVDKSKIKEKVVKSTVDDKKNMTENLTEPFVEVKKKVTDTVRVSVEEEKEEITDKVLDPVVEDKKNLLKKVTEVVAEKTQKLSENVTVPAIKDKEEVSEKVMESVEEVEQQVSKKVTEQVVEEKENLPENVTVAAVEDKNPETVQNTIIKSESGSIDSDFEDNISIAAMCRSYSEESKTSKESTSGCTSTKSCVKPKRKPSKDKNTMQDKMEIHQALQDPEFLKYIELRQDALMDENPHVTGDEIVEYLFRTWLYSESLKSDTVKSFDKEQSTLVKGLSDEPPPQPKKIRKKIKVEKDKEKEKASQSNEDIVPKDRSKRKVARAYYNENDTDLEDELQVFEIFKMINKQPAKTKDENVETPNTEATLETVKEETEQSEAEVYVDDAEIFFSQLAKPKPNVFKGIPRERLCEICEKPGSLIKCKGLCGGMYHSDCVRKQTEEPPKAPNGPTRGRKKKKPRGRKPKSLDDSGSQSDDKKDLNLSEETITDEIQLENNLVIDADNFETQLEKKMQEMLKSDLPADYDYSSEDELHWNDTVAGKCEIVDVKLKLRRQDNEFGDFKCNGCLKNEIPVCFVCKSATSPKNSVELRQKCQTAHCHKYYHLECLDIWPQTQFNSGEPSRNNKKISENFEAMTCPRHVCHTCVCDDPRGCNTRFSGDKLARCVRCPATYHSFNKCLPAGSTILSASHIICPRHYEHRPGKVPCHVNTGWCFICALGGTLICCEYCPTSFHAECLNIKPPEGNYMCEDCETGRLPLYGEMMWVKLGHYRWWPGIVLHPCEIPENIMAVKHSQGEFVVRFFGQYDHYWVNRGRVFPFQEGDSGKVSGQKSKIDEAFTMAMEHAQRACEILKNAAPNEEEDTDIASSLLPPHYVKLKVNKPCGALVNYKPDDEENSLTLCECDPNDIEPCGPDTHCLNRMLLTECGPTCRAGDRCCNRAFENRQYPKLTPYRTSWGGWGLKTLEPIRQGQFVIEYVGELLDEAEFRRRMQRKHETRDENYYFLTLDRDRMIDAGPKGNLARFMNHCCEPNCETQKWTVLGDVRVGLFALRDIPANSEVTFNYNLECAGIEKKPCLCGAKRCSGYIGAKPKQDETQPKKSKLQTKRAYKKRKLNVEASPSASTSKTKVVKPRMTQRSRPKEEKELTEIEKDLLIIKNATNGLSSDSESSGRLSSIDNEKVSKEEVKPLKRKRVSFSKDEAVCNGEMDSPTVKKIKLDSESLGVGD